MKTKITTVYAHYFLNIFKILAAIIFLIFYLILFLISFPFVWLKWYRDFLANIGDFLETILYVW